MCLSPAEDNETNKTPQNDLVKAETTSSKRRDATEQMTEIFDTARQE